MILSVLSSLALVSGLMVVRAKNPVHSVLFPIPVFRNTSGLLLLLGLDFFAMIFPVVHIGAIAVSFLFVVMMFHIQIAEIHEEVLRYLPVSGIIGLIFWWEMFFILDNESIPLLPTQRNTTSLRYMVYAGKVRSWTNLETLGNLLYTYYSVWFLVPSLILLVAMIGAIVLTMHRTTKVKRQDVFRRNAIDSRRTIMRGMTNRLKESNLILVRILLLIFIISLFYFLSILLGLFSIMSKVAGFIAVKVLSSCLKKGGLGSAVFSGILFLFLGGSPLLMEMNSSNSGSWGDYLQTSQESEAAAPADAGPVPHGNRVSNSTEGPASPDRFPYEPDERIGGDSVLSIQHRILSLKPFPSAEEIYFARMQAEDLFEVKAQIIERMKVLDPTGDWQGRGARALDSPNSATGESSLKRLYSLLHDLEMNGQTSRAFFSLSEKVALRKNNLDAESSA